MPFFSEYTTVNDILPSPDCDPMLLLNMATHDSVPAWTVTQFQSLLSSITPKSNFS